MLGVPLLSVVWVFSFALPVFDATAEFEDRPVWDSVQLCDIPNEANPGECKLLAECGAFGKINDVESLGSLERFSFIKQLQCNVSDVEPYVCCPRNSDAYLAPYINDTMEEAIRISSRTDDDTCGIQAIGGRIRGGQLADIDEFPWTAMLLYQYGKEDPEQGCGGALISRTFVITAAHCITGKYMEHTRGRLKYVRLQEYNTVTDPDCILEYKLPKNCALSKIDLPPQAIIPHPEYKPESLHQQHDVGLIRIEQTPPFNDYVRSICLPELYESSESKGKKFSVSGWGKTDLFASNMGPDAMSPIKLKIKLPYVEQEQCNEAFQSFRISLGEGQMCAGGEGGRDTCQGDSGSPLMDFDVTRGAWYIKGIVSFGLQTCGMKGFPGVYTNVHHYMPWIQMHTTL